VVSIVDEKPEVDSWSGASPSVQVDGQFTSVKFRSEARVILRRNLGEADEGSLRDYQQEFIGRGEKLNPTQRYELIVLLQHNEQKLAGSADPFTEEELSKIEAMVLAEH
jgi:hypothetical protein